ncbi:hypothetical protein ACIGO6_34490 [Streptomyces sp. NPDC053750]|uniref:hypothetical protein n=1 Tax=Streptomyces sp. NPDC053750 TaxID=3365714 RepID=UPI0037D2B692
MASKPPSAFQQALKDRAAELGPDILAAVEAAINDWRDSTSGGTEADTAGARSFSGQ